jgi:hypothetical protein
MGGAVAPRDSIEEKVEKRKEEKEKNPQGHTVLTSILEPQRDRQK